MRVPLGLREKERDQLVEEGDIGVQRDAEVLPPSNAFVPIPLQECGRFNIVNNWVKSPDGMDFSRHLVRGRSEEKDEEE